MKGFEFDPDAGTLALRDAGRDAFVFPDSVPVQMLPDELVVNNHDAVYPDVPKGRVTTHQWGITRAIVLEGDNIVYHFSAVENGKCAVTALPQEWSTTTILAPAPAGADVFAMLVRLNRTVAPTNHWPSGISVATVQNQWIPLTGSILLEVGFGFARAMSIYISGGNLVLHQQQSVTTSPGGYGNLPGNPGGEPANITVWAGDNFRNGGEAVHNGTAGIPIYYGGNSAPQYRARQVNSSTGFPTWPAVPRNHRASGTQPPTTSDPTDIGSTWRIDLRGQFGRRS